MRRAFLITVVLTLIASGAFSADTVDARLQSQLRQMSAQHRGKVALWARNLKTGETVAINAAEPVQTASVIKLPVMIEAFYQAKAGRLQLGQKLKLTKDNQVPGSGVLQFMDPGLEVTLKDAITLMMIESDNTATNMVLDVVGIKAVDQRIAAMGLKNTYLYRKVFKPADPADGPLPPDQQKFGLGKTTAREMGEALASIERCDIGDRALCKTMIGIMKNQQYRNMIPHYLETADTSEQESAIADKLGALDEVRNDVGLVYTKAGPIVISIFTWDNKDQSWIMENEAELAIARMAKTIVTTWSPNGLGLSATK
jgi:beta-lactamase class A